MPRPASKQLTELELTIMRTLWARPGGEGTVESIREALETAGRPLALPSIRTMLTILMKKGYVSDFNKLNQLYD